MRNIRRSAYLLNAGLATACLFSVAWKPAPPPVFHGIAPGDVPRRLSGGRYAATGDVTLNKEVRETLSAGTVIYRTYADTAAGTAAAASLDFVLIGGTNRSALHDPRTCFAGAGWKINDTRTITLPGTTVDASACRLVRDREAYDVVYLYVSEGKVLHQATGLRQEMLLSNLFQKQSRPVYFFRCIRAVSGGDPLGTMSDAPLEAFAAAMWKNLHGKLGYR